MTEHTLLYYTMTLHIIPYDESKHYPPERRQADHHEGAHRDLSAQRRYNMLCTTWFDICCSMYAVTYDI